ncbi:hypothetical protein ACFFX0_23775 [Citricoccus parietis]|uniref:Uncharacterized protein n=1 Tax=Citricoccus parietis TaxID=592307 RepID=A0ABV5FSX4_9MICC
MAEHLEDGVGDTVHVRQEGFCDHSDSHGPMMTVCRRREARGAVDPRWRSGELSVSRADPGVIPVPAVRRVAPWTVT